MQAEYIVIVMRCTYYMYNSYILLSFTLTHTHTHAHTESACAVGKSFVRYLCNVYTLLTQKSRFNEFSHLNHIKNIFDSLIMVQYLLLIAVIDQKRSY